MRKLIYVFEKIIAYDKVIDVKYDGTIDGLAEFVKLAPLQRVEQFQEMGLITKHFLCEVCFEKCVVVKDSRGKDKRGYLKSVHHLYL